MPFPLAPKPSKTKNRNKAPPPALTLDLATHKLVETASLPTPLSATSGALTTGDCSSSSQQGFKMFSWKKKPEIKYQPSSPMDNVATPPRPILKVRSQNPPELKDREGSVGWNENRARGNVGENNVTENKSRTPSVVISSYDGPVQKPAPSLSHRVSSRKSSRPCSPASTSFGARIRSESIPSPVARYQTPPPMSSSYITTPPAAYVSSFQSRAPPSPYRPTHERQRSQTLPELNLELDTIGPVRHSSLFPMTRPTSGFSDRTVTISSSDSANTIKDVPMLNIIPATPQDDSDEFPKGPDGPSPCTLEEAMTINERDMEDVPLDIGSPVIDIDLDFSPFGHIINLPGDVVEHQTPIESEMITFPAHETVQTSSPMEIPTAPTDPLPPSPPFNSYPSYPSFTSLPSESSMPSFNTSDSMPSTLSAASSSSLHSFPDVEEALGTMLASLASTDSHDQMMDLDAPTEKPQPTWSTNDGLRLGLGLGLDLPDEISITAPLSPRRRRPPPLKLVQSSSSRSFSSTSTFENNVPYSAPARITSHRIPFYQTAKPHPSVVSIHTRDLSYGSHFSNEAIIYEDDDSPRDHRDSISSTSETSDDDLHTASIINLADTPLARSIVRMPISPGHEMVHEVGVAL